MTVETSSLDGKARTRVAVFLGSSKGSDSKYVDVAEALGRALGAAGYDINFGGANVGCMGKVKDGVIAGGGHAFGFMPRMFSNTGGEMEKTGGTLSTSEKSQQKEDKLKIVTVESGDDRFKHIILHSEAAILLPGGYGSFEELSSLLGCRQNGLTAIPIVVVNINGFFQHILQQFEKARSEGFIGDNDSVKKLIHEVTCKEGEDTAEGWAEGCMETLKTLEKGKEPKSVSYKFNVEKDFKAIINRLSLDQTMNRNCLYR